MGMRASDARWLERDVAPFLEQVVGATPASPALRTRLDQQAHELLAQLRDRTGSARHDPFDTGPDGVRLEIIGGRVWRAVVDDYPVPYLEVHELDRDPREKDDPVEYKIVVTEAFGKSGASTHPMTADDCYSTIWILAQAMAVAAGWTCHGKRSFPRNPHGAPVGMAGIVDLEPAELHVAEGWGPDTIADRVVERLAESDPVLNPRSPAGRWFEAARFHAENEAYWKTRTEAAEAAIDRALDELGVPTNDYVAPVSNAVSILRFIRSQGDVPVGEPPDLEPVDPEAVAAARCEHPADGVFWNAGNRAVQCHRCGHAYQLGETVWPRSDYRLYVPPDGAPDSVPHYVRLERPGDSVPAWAVRAQNSPHVVLALPPLHGHLELAVQAAVALDGAAYPVESVEG